MDVPVILYLPDFIYLAALHSPGSFDRRPAYFRCLIV
jgi:hypothetical protein